MYLPSKLPGSTPVAPAEPVIDETGQRLLQAAQIIHQLGWCQGAYQRDGKVCPVTAITMAYGVYDISSWTPAELRLRTHVGGDVIDWNDQEGRTAAEVIAALTAAGRMS